MPRGKELRLNEDSEDPGQSAMSPHLFKVKNGSVFAYNTFENVTPCLLS